MNDDYFVRKISMSLEKIERHLSEISRAIVNLKLETERSNMDQPKKKEEEE